MTIVLPQGVLFRGNEEETIRMNLIEKNNIETCGDGPFVSVPLFMPVEKQGDRHKRTVSMTFLVTN